MATKKLSERFALSSGAVDRDAGVIRGVLVCGTESANGRRYPWGAGLTCDPAVYEGRPVNCDHGKAATVDRRLGWLANVRVGADGRPRADLHVLTSHPMAARVLEAAGRNPSLFGLSHVAVASTRMDRGIEIIESIKSVESVDLVADPATTKGLYEGTMPTPLKTFLEAVGGKRAAAAKKWSKSKVVREMDELMGDAPPDLPPPPAADEAGPDDGISAAFKTALDAVCADLLSNSGDPAKIKELVAKIKKLAHAHGDINGDGQVDAADVDAADDSDAAAEDAPAMESKGAKYVLSLMADLEAAGLKVTTENLDTVGSHPAAKRPALLRRLTEAAAPAGEKPRTTARQTPVTESKGKTDAPAAASAVSEFRRA